MIIIQGHSVEASIARQIAALNNLEILALENTFFSWKLIAEPVSGIAVNRNSSGAHIEKVKSKYFFLDNEAWLAKTINEMEELKSVEHASPKKIYEWPRSEKKILFLAQVYTDSSLIFGTNGKLSTIDAVKSLVSYCTQTNSHLFIKLHPKEFMGETPLGRPYNRLTYRKLVQAGITVLLEKENTSCEIDSANEFSTKELIATSDVVVTINSQSALEALAQGKEAVLLGITPYMQQGFAWHLSDIGLLPSALDLVLNNGARLNDTTQVAMYLRSYHDDYCINKDSHSVLAALKTRIN